jgi:hypothetical protein
MKKFVLLLFVAIFPAAACGCAINERTQQVLILKSLADNQRSMQEYVDAQERGFDRLSKDIAADRLRSGTSKQRVVEEYSEPIDCRELNEPGKQEVCLFRHPNDFLSDSVYLYFNDSGQLTKWRFKPD